MEPSRTRAVFLCSFATGFTGLAYEAVWQRYLTAVLGSNVKATVLVTGVFLAAMSLGCALAGRITRIKPAKIFLLYGWAEIALGAWAATMPIFFRASTHIPGYFSGSGLAVDLPLTILLIAPPAAIMGATIPALTHLLSSRPETLPQSHSLLYGCNTIGAFFGIVVAGFHLIDMLGLNVTSWVLAPINLMIGAYFVSSSAYFQYAAPPTPEPQKTTPPHPGANLSLLLAAVVLSSFSFLALENLIMRIGIISSPGSALIFILTISVFVLLTGAGAIAAGLAGKHTNRMVPWALALSCAGWLLVYLTIDHWPYYVHMLDSWSHSHHMGMMQLQLVRLAALGTLLLLPLLPAGAFLPLCFSVLADSNQGKAISASGAIYGASALGLALGAVLGGYWILHWAGLDEAFQLAIAAQIAALILAAAATRTRSAGIAFSAIALSIGTFLLPDFNKRALALSYHQGLFPDGIPEEDAARDALYDFYGITRLLSFSTGPEASVSVFEQGAQPQKNFMLAVNAHPQATTADLDRNANALMGVLAYLLTQDPSSALVIGVGSGVSMGTLGFMEGVSKVDALEISPEVIRQAPRFDSKTHDASQNPKIRTLGIDAIRFLNSDGKRYGIITSMPPNLWSAGTETLYSKEFYKSVRGRLKQNGIFVQWVPDYSFSNELLATVARTMESVFIDVTLWRLTPHHLAFVYYNGENPFENLERIRKRSRERPYRDSLASMGVELPLYPLFLQVTSSDMTRKIADFGRLHTADKPVIERMARKAQFTNLSGSQSLRFIREFAPLGKTSPSGFFTHHYQRRYGNFSVPKISADADVICARLQVESTPCRHLTLAIPPNLHKPEVAKHFNRFVPHYRTAAILKAFQAATPAQKTRRLKELQVRDEEIQRVLKKFQNPIRPLTQPQPLETSL